ncbi:MAG: hydroxyacid dehydrogenase [Phycisphaerae bacterium]
MLYEPGTQEPALATAVADSRAHALVVRSTQVTRATLDAAKELTLIIRAGAGTDTIDVPAATARGVRVCNCPGTNSVAVAELTFGLMIALDRRIVDETADLRRGVWNKKEYSRARGLKGRTLGIVGLGRIGAEVAKRAHAFEMELIYADTVRREDMEREFALKRVTLDELLATADFVTLHVPGGADTRHLIGPAQLARMKPTAFIVNCSRGGVIDEQALCAAIRDGKLAGAALDVWEIEPAANDKLFRDPAGKDPHVYGTHHVGASTEQAQSAVGEETVRIIKTLIRSGRLINCVNPK